MTARAQFRDGDAGFEQFHVAHDVLVTVLHRIDHLGRGRAVADPPASAYIDADSIAADKVGIETDDFIVLHDPPAAFLKPGVGART